MTQLSPEQEAKARDALIKRDKVKRAPTVLRQWSLDLQNSPATTTQNVVQQVQTMKDRLAILFDNFADIIESTIDPLA